MYSRLRAFLAFASLLFSVQSGWAGILSFTASPTIFLPGQEVTLSWSVTAGAVISINQGIGAVSGATGSVKVIPTALTTYTLTDATSSTTAQATATPVTATALTHRWSFNEASGTAATDSAGGTKGTLINAVSGTNWTRTNGAGEQNAPGGSFSGTEYITLSAQVGGTATSRRLSMRDNNVENFIDLADAVSYGNEFHFACVYDSAGNSGTPRFSYYKNGVLVGSLNTASRAPSPCARRM